MSEEQVIRVKCPNLSCLRILAVPVHARGKIVRCQQCGMSIRIPPKKEESHQGQTAEG